MCIYHSSHKFWPFLSLKFPRRPKAKLQSQIQVIKNLYQSMQNPLPFTRISLHHNFREPFINHLTSRPPYQKSRVDTFFLPFLPFPLPSSLPVGKITAYQIASMTIFPVRPSVCLPVTLPFQDIHPLYNILYLNSTHHLLLPNVREFCNH